MDFTIEPGTKVKGSDGQKYKITETTSAKGEFVEVDLSKQKTYMLKASCPVCHRIIRLTQKNWEKSDVRLAIGCMHTNNEMHEFILSVDTESNV